MAFKINFWKYIEWVHALSWMYMYTFRDPYRDIGLIGQPGTSSKSILLIITFYFLHFHFVAFMLSKVLWICKVLINLILTKLCSWKFEGLTVWVCVDVEVTNPGVLVESQEVII